MEKFFFAYQIEQNLLHYSAVMVMISLIFVVSKGGVFLLHFLHVDEGLGIEFDFVEAIGAPRELRTFFIMEVVHWNGNQR